MQKMYCFLFLGSVREKAPILSCGDPWDREVPSLESVVPLDTGTAYNMLDVIQGKFLTRLQKVKQIFKR